MTITLPSFPKLASEHFTWLLVALLSFAGGHYVGKHGLPSIGGIVAPATVKVTAATYFYEKNSGGVPPPVTAALSTLNGQGITATSHEIDATNPSGKVPKQYEVSLPAAVKAGLPVLVVMAGDKVLRTVPKPTTAKEVEEAAK